MLAVGAFQDGTAVDMGESYDRTGHGAVYLFQQNLCCFNGSVMATSGDACGAPYSPDSCDDVWGQVTGLLCAPPPPFTYTQALPAGCREHVTSALYATPPCAQIGERRGEAAETR